MAADERTATARALTNYRTAIIAGLVTALGLVVVIFAPTWFQGEPGIRSIAEEVGGLLIVTGALTMFWDLRGRRDLINEVFAKAQLSSEVQTSGLTGISTLWNAVPWPSLIKGAREIVIFIAYGTSWRNLHWTHLEEFAQKKNCSLTLVLPNPDDDLTMRVLAQRFDYTIEKVQGQVREMAEAIAGLEQPGGATIRVYYRDGDPTYTLYKFDNQYIATLYANRRKRGDIPTMVMQEGSLHDFFTEELDAIIGQSVAQSLNDLKARGKQ